MQFRDPPTTGYQNGLPRHEVIYMPSTATSFFEDMCLTLSRLLEVQGTKGSFTQVAFYMWMPHKSPNISISKHPLLLPSRLEFITAPCGLANIGVWRYGGTPCFFQERSIWPSKKCCWPFWTPFLSTIATVVVAYLNSLQDCCHQHLNNF